MRHLWGLVALVAVLQAGDAASTEPLAAGDVISYAELARLRPFLPRELWRLREQAFYEGMRLEIGTPHKDYSPAAAYEAATRRFTSSGIGADGSLIGHVAGQPFPMASIDCQQDPHAGIKLAWNFDQQWEGSGSEAHFRVTFPRKGRARGSSFEGRIRTLQLAGRVDDLTLQDPTVPERDRRKLVTQTAVTSQGGSGPSTVFTRFDSSEGPLANARLDETWRQLPGVGRDTLTHSRHRSNPLEGAEIVPDDLGSFAGVVTQYEWKCLGEMELLAPVDSQIRAYPYSSNHDFGPSGLSFASDRWELRRVVKLRMTPKDPEHPYARKDLYLDRQTLRALYSFAYDGAGALWKAIWHNGRFSESEPAYYPGWPGVPVPRDAKTVADAVLNVQTGLGTRIEYWDNHGTPFGDPAEIQRFLSRFMREQGI
jgi:hypothetical protein